MGITGHWKIAQSLTFHIGIVSAWQTLTSLEWSSASSKQCPQHSANQGGNVIPEHAVLMETTSEPPSPAPHWLTLLPQSMVWQQSHTESQLTGVTLWFPQPDAQRHSWADVWCAQEWARLSASMGMLKYLSVIWKCLSCCEGAAAHAVHSETSTQLLGTFLPFLDDIWAAGKQFSD